MVLVVWRERKTLTNTFLIMTNYVLNTPVTFCDKMSSFSIEIPLPSPPPEVGSTNWSIVGLEGWG